ncbi:MAG TPA: HlyC/CorC family transporter [Fusobacteriaceae bacterium]|nr:HlyC/CorC family transporter [Fusobacteriaceae bacterium]
MEIYSQLILLAVLIILSGLFSASETALTAFKSTDLEEIENTNPRTAKLLKRWLTKPNEILTAILLGNNIVNILASSIATIVTMQIMGSESGHTVAIATICMTVVVLIFGEITPKIVAKTYSKQISGIVIGPIYLLSVATLPIIQLLMFITEIISGLMGVNIKYENLMITEEEIKSYINFGKAEGVIEEEEREMIHSIIEFGDTTAKEVMTPRTSIFMLDAESTIDEVWDEIIDSGYSRIPVYGEDLDEILGILYVKDLMTLAKKGTTDIPLKNILRKAYFVPDTKSIVEILDEFRDQQVHMAIVLDEYGGTVGLTTIEDLIEEIIGEIKDEYDLHEEDEIEKISETKYKVDARINIEDLNKELELNIPESEDYESLGGYVLDILGRVAEVGDIVELDGLSMKVLEIEKMRVVKIIIEISEEIE